MSKISSRFFIGGCASALALGPRGLFAASDARVLQPTKCRIALDRLATGDVPFAVTAYSSFGKASAPLKGTFAIGGG